MSMHLSPCHSTRRRVGIQDLPYEVLTKIFQEAHPPLDEPWRIITLKDTIQYPMLFSGVEDQLKWLPSIATVSRHLSTAIQTVVYEVIAIACPECNPDSDNRETFDLLVETLTNNPHLASNVRQLFVHSCYHDDSLDPEWEHGEVDEIMASILPCLTGLRSFGLLNCCSSRNWFTTWYNAISIVTKYTHYNRETLSAPQSFREADCDLEDDLISSLTELELGGINLRGTRFPSIKTLTSLKLEATDISIAGLDRLLAASSGNLEALHLYFGGFQPSRPYYKWFIQTLQEQPQSFSKLVYLTISDNHSYFRANTPKEYHGIIDLILQVCPKLIRLDARPFTALPSIFQYGGLQASQLREIKCKIHKPDMEAFKTLLQSDRGNTLDIMHFFLVPEDGMEKDKLIVQQLRDILEANMRPVDASTLAGQAWSEEEEEHSGDDEDTDEDREEDSDEYKIYKKAWETANWICISQEEALQRDTDSFGTLRMDTDSGGEPTAEEMDFAQNDEDDDDAEWW